MLAVPGLLLVLTAHGLPTDWQLDAYRFTWQHRTNGSHWYTEQLLGDPCWQAVTIVEIHNADIESNVTMENNALINLEIPHYLGYHDKTNRYLNSELFIDLNFLSTKHVAYSALVELLFFNTSIMDNIIIQTENATSTPTPTTETTTATTPAPCTTTTETTTATTTATTPAPSTTTTETTTATTTATTPAPSTTTTETTTATTPALSTTTEKTTATTPAPCTTTTEKTTATTPAPSTTTTETTTATTPALSTTTEKTTATTPAPCTTTTEKTTATTPAPSTTTTETTTATTPVPSATTTETTTSTTPTPSTTTTKTTTTTTPTPSTTTTEMTSASPETTVTSTTVKDTTTTTTPSEITTTPSTSTFSEIAGTSTTVTDTRTTTTPTPTITKASTLSSPEPTTTSTTVMETTTTATSTTTSTTVMETTTTATPTTTSTTASTSTSPETTSTPATVTDTITITAPSKSTRTTTTSTSTSKTTWISATGMDDTTMIPSWNAHIVVYNIQYTCSCASLKSVKWPISFQKASKQKLYCDLNNKVVAKTAPAQTFSENSCPNLLLLVLSAGGSILMSGLIFLLCLAIHRWQRLSRLRNEEICFTENFQLERAEAKFVAMLSFSGEEKREKIEYIHQTLERHLKDKLRVNRDTVCIDYKHFRVGYPVVSEMINAIDKSAVMVFVVSKSFCRHQWCITEFEEALSQKKPMILLYTEHVDVNDMPDPLRKVHDRYTRAKLLETADGSFELVPSASLIAESIIELASMSRETTTIDMV